MKYAGLRAAFLFAISVALLSCEDGRDMIVGGSPRYNPGTPQPIAVPSGLIGTFSGTVQDKDHTKTGTLTISITSMDANGSLTGTLALTGFSDCFTKGVFPDPNHMEYEHYYSPSRGFGFLMAGGAEPGSYTYIHFDASGDFYKGMALGGVENPAFFNGSAWCLEIDPVILERQ